MKLKVGLMTTILSFFYCLKFSFVVGDGELSLPDDGRIKIVECLRTSLGLHEGSCAVILETDPVEIVYEKICSMSPKLIVTKYNRYLFEKNKDAEGNMKSCLKKKSTLVSDKNTSETLVNNLFNRYRNIAASNSKDTDGNQNGEIVSAFFLFIEGFCNSSEIVKFNNLKISFKSEAIKCLKKCAVKLFQNFEKRIAELDSTIKAEKKAEDFDVECQKQQTSDIKKLTKVGAGWLRKYDMAFMKAFKHNRRLDVEERLKYDLDNYCLCAKFICAMSSEDTPFDAWITNKISFIDRDLEELLVS